MSTTFCLTFCNKIINKHNKDVNNAMNFSDIVNIVKPHESEVVAQAGNVVQATSAMCMPTFLKYILLGAFTMLGFVISVIVIYIKVKKIVLKAKASALDIANKINNKQ